MAIYDYAAADEDEISFNEGGPHVLWGGGCKGGGGGALLGIHTRWDRRKLYAAHVGQQSSVYSSPH